MGERRLLVYNNSYRCSSDLMQQATTGRCVSVGLSLVHTWCYLLLLVKKIRLKYSGLSLLFTMSVIAKYCLLRYNMCILTINKQNEILTGYNDSLGLAVYKLTIQCHSLGLGNIIDISQYFWFGNTYCNTFLCWQYIVKTNLDNLSKHFAFVLVFF